MILKGHVYLIRKFQTLTISETTKEQKIINVSLNPVLKICKPRQNRIIRDKLPTCMHVKQIETRKNFKNEVRAPDWKAGFITINPCLFRYSRIKYPSLAGNYIISASADIIKSIIL